MTENKAKGLSRDEINQYFKTENQGNSRFEYKDKSLLAKMGFQDSQLKTPEHDKMIDILMNDNVLSKISELSGHDSSGKWIKKEEFVIQGHNGYIIGYIDIVAIPVERQCSKNCTCFIIEVKPIIDSIGELIRQLNTYRSAIESSQGKYFELTKYENHKHMKKHAEARCNGEIMKDCCTDYVVISNNTTDNQRTRLNNADICLFDIKELI